MSRAEWFETLFLSIRGCAIPFWRIRRCRKGSACCSPMCHLSNSSLEPLRGSDGAGAGPALVARL
jgi:hypothetical protein